MNHQIARRRGPPRRGMLLLLVLSILALFIVMGAVGILLAMRALESARAFAKASAGAVGSSALARSQLDESLLRLIRGANPAGPITESLLEDKYGSSETVSITTLSGTASAVMTATVSGLTNASNRAGLVLTFVPQAADSTLPSSYRILRSTGTASNVLLLANVKPLQPLPLPSRFPCQAVINGREFAGQSSNSKNEPYDAFDDRNPFLTQPVLQGGRVTSIRRPAFGGAGTPCTVDNDGDGVPDGIWLSDVLPKQRTTEGGELSFDVSYLVLDLDGRINVNAHGSFVSAWTPRTSYVMSGTSAAIGSGTSAAIGMGYGAADVDGTLAVAGESVGAARNRWAQLIQGGALTTSATISTGTQWRPAPRAEANQAGRYGLGASAGPGAPTTITGTNPLIGDFWMTGMYAGNSPTDLKAQTQVLLEGSNPPTLRFHRPVAWPFVSATFAGSMYSCVTGSIAARDDVMGTGNDAHPYRLRLDQDAPRAAGSSAVDAPYTLGELERVLRQFDADAATLAPRLAVILDDYAERCRMTITTDSWDTPAIVGETVGQVLAKTGTNVSPDVAAGLRFGLNRPITSGSARQEYFKHLYTLLRGLVPAVAPAEAAQWAANVVEFRDADSVMTWYPYVPDPFTTAWPGTTGTLGVWGAERPEMVIRKVEPPAGNRVAVELYRPWKAICTSPVVVDGLPAEPIDPALGEVVPNTLDVTRVIGTGSNPVWRLAIGGSATGLNTLIADGTAVATNTRLGPVSLSTSGVPTQVFLQRLANPSGTFNPVVSSTTYNDYVVIHAVDVPPEPPPGTTPPPVASGTIHWLHWPNRDLVSHGELLAVQSGSAASLAAAMLDPSKQASLATTYPQILNATIVPSRFVGTHVSVGSGAFLNNTGLENFQHGQFSRWREPGRVNVNTILPNQSNTPEAFNNNVWMALVGRSGLDNPVTSGPTYSPIANEADLLTSGSLLRSGDDMASAFLRRGTAIRLANVATTRSHAFAVWITLKITDSSPNASGPRFHRVFAIVDRSIPVGYQAGNTLNVRDTIRLVRYLE